MTAPPSALLFYKSSLCPRCMLVGRQLRRLRQEHPELKIEEIDIVAHPLRAWRDGIRMIPALRAGGDLLSGVVLTEGEIRSFLTRYLERAAPGPSPS